MSCFGCYERVSMVPLKLIIWLSDMEDLSFTGLILESRIWTGYFNLERRYQLYGAIEGAFEAWLWCFAYIESILLVVTVIL